MWAALEVGPFSWVMICSYVAFLDPDWFGACVRRWTDRRRRHSQLAAT
jgi:hypothetical protein